MIVALNLIEIVIQITENKLHMKNCWEFTTNTVLYVMKVQC